MTIRVASPLARELVTAGLADPISSEHRSDTLDLFVQVGIAVKEVSSVILAIAGGLQGFRVVLDWLQGRDLDEEVTLTVNLADGSRSWQLRAGRFDDATKLEIVRVLEALDVDS